MRDADELLRMVGDGEIEFAVAVRHEAAHFIKLRDLIVAIPGYGPVRSTNLLGDLGIAPWLQCSEVSDAQLDRLLAAMA